MRPYRLDILGQATARTIIVNPPGPLGASGGSIAHLREHNLSRILLVLAAEGPLSRSQIAARTGLGNTAMTKLIVELRERHLVSDISDTNPTTMGRPTSLVTMAQQLWAIASLSLASGCGHYWGNGPRIGKHRISKLGRKPTGSSIWRWRVRPEFP